MTRKTNNKQCVQTNFSSQSEVEGTLMKRVSFLETQYAIKTQLGQGIGTKRLCIQTYDTGTTRNAMLFSQRAISLHDSEYNCTDTFLCCLPLKPHVTSLPFLWV